MLKPVNAAPVEYVKICALYGVGFYYVPGTDTCFNPATNDARDQTMAGTWLWRVPNNPLQWVRTPKDACHNGKLIKFGDINSSGLVQNAHSRYETTSRYQLSLKHGQYIASVLYRGGFTGVGQGNFCMYYYYEDPTLGPLYQPFGCIDTSPRADAPATLMFSPDIPIPPATTNQTYVLGANGESWDVTSAAQIQGTLSVWLCLKTSK